MMARWITRWKPSVNIGRARAQHLGRAGVVQEREQQMLHRDELVALLARLDKRHVQTNFQFLGNHVISFCLADDVMTERNCRF
jgi:hypothetical protein